jgi:hypothetical protein
MNYIVIYSCHREVNFSVNFYLHEFFAPNAWEIKLIRLFVIYPSQIAFANGIELKIRSGWTKETW